MRNQIAAIAGRVEAARDLLEMARRHICAAAIEGDPQYSTALLTLGGTLADFAELILRNVNDGPEPMREPDVVEHPQQPTTPMQWREDFSTSSYCAERDKYRATVFEGAGEWLWRVTFDGRFRQYGVAESMTKAMQEAEDCIVARIIRNETIDAEMAVMS